MDGGTDHSSELSNGEWYGIFSYGMVKGEAKCSNNSTGTPSNTTGQKCWCRVTSYTPTGGNQCNIADPSWVLTVDYDGFDEGYTCVADCARVCTTGLRNSEEYWQRAELFGIPMPEDPED